MAGHLVPPGSVSAFWAEHRREGLLRAARAQARTEESKRAYPTRSSVERIIAWILA